MTKQPDYLADVCEVIGRTALALAHFLRGHEESLAFRPGFPRMLDIRNKTRQYKPRGKLT